MILNSRVLVITIIICLVLTPIAAADSATHPIQDPETDPLHTPADENIGDNGGNLTAASTAPSIAWEQTHGGAGQQGWNDLVKLNDGGYLLIGSTTQGSTMNAWVMEVDSEGNQEWEQTYGGFANDTFRAGVKADNSGYILVGETISNGISGSETGWIVKIDDSGDKQWERTYGGQGSDRLKDVVNANDGEYLAVGHREPSPGEDFEIWGVKIDASGSAAWSKTWTDFDDETDAAFGVAEVENEFIEDDYIIVGQSWEGDDEFFDAYVTKVDDTGFQWNEKTFGTSEGDFFYDVTATSGGDYVITGYQDARWNSTGLYYDDGSVSLFKIAEDLGSFWQRTYGGSEEDVGREVIQLSAGGYVVGGYTHSMGQGFYDGYVVKTNSNGVEQWEQNYGGGGSDKLFAVANTSERNLVIAGDNEANSDTDGWIAQLGGKSSGPDETGPMGDVNLTTHATFWQGQELYFDATDVLTNNYGDNPTALQRTFQIRRVSGDNNENVGNLVDEITVNEDTLDTTIDTATLDGFYVVTHPATGQIVSVSNGEASFDGAISNVDADNFDWEIAPQTISTSFDPDDVPVKQHETATLEISSNRGSGYIVNISAEGLDSGDLEKIWGWDQAIEYIDFRKDVVGVEVDVDGELEANFSIFDRTGSYTFEFEVADTTASDSASIQINEKDVNISFAGNGVFSQQIGDVAEITINLADTDTGYVFIGGQDVNFLERVEVVDGDGDGTVTLEMDTFSAHMAGAGSYSVGDSDDQIESVTELSSADFTTEMNNPIDTQPLGSPLEAGEYGLSVSTTVDIEVTDDGKLHIPDETDTGTLELTDSKSSEESPVIARVEPGSTTMATGGATTVEIVVTNTTAGVQSYEFDLNLSDAGIADITAVSPEGTTQSAVGTTVSIGPESDTVSVSVASGSAADDGVISTVTIEGTSVGNTTLDLGNVVVGDTNFNSYNISTVSDGQLQVTNVSVQPVVGNNLPTDQDGDGKYEDVTGDGRFNILDVGAFLQNRNSEAVQNNIDAFDFTGDGRVNILDVGKLLQMTI